MKLSPLNEYTLLQTLKGLDEKMATLQEDIDANKAATDSLRDALSTLVADVQQFQADQQAIIDQLKASGGQPDPTLLAELEANTQELTDSLTAATTADQQYHTATSGTPGSGTPNP